MPNPTIQSLLKKLDLPDLAERLNKLSLSELNSLLMEVFRTRAGDIKPSDLLNAYKHNRFVHPSTVDPLEFYNIEIALLQLARQRGFNLFELSPLAPFGTCAAVAPADQNRIVSALRGTEVVSDATNVLALESSHQRITAGFDDSVSHVCAVHRHVRAQSFEGKGFSAHFKVFCAVSCGRDSGNFGFEMDTLVKHLLLYRDFFRDVLQLKRLKITIKSMNAASGPSGLAVLAKKIFTSSCKRSCI